MIYNEEIRKKAELEEIRKYNSRFLKKQGKRIFLENNVKEDKKSRKFLSRLNPKKKLKRFIPKVPKTSNVIKNLEPLDIIMIPFAGMIDLLDFTGIGIFITFFLKFFIFVYLLKEGSPRVKMFKIAMGFADIVTVALPLSTVAVIYAIATREKKKKV